MLAAQARILLRKLEGGFFGIRDDLVLTFSDMCPVGVQDFAIDLGLNEELPRRTRQEPLRRFLNLRYSVGQLNLVCINGRDVNVLIPFKPGVPRTVFGTEPKLHT
jgi:hypothetical protein